LNKSSNSHIWEGLKLWFEIIQNHLNQSKFCCFNLKDIFLVHYLLSSQSIENGPTKSAQTTPTGLADHPALARFLFTSSKRAGIFDGNPPSPSDSQTSPTVFQPTFSFPSYSNCSAQSSLLAHLRLTSLLAPTSSRRRQLRRASLHTVSTVIGLPHHGAQASPDPPLSHRINVAAPPFPFQNHRIEGTHHCCHRRPFTASLTL
jgi:hypothetical protein